MTRWAKDVTPDKPLPEYPRPQMARKDWLNLNGLWDHAVAPKADAAPQSYQGKILVPFAIESALSGVMKPVGTDNRLWYRRTFEAPARPADGRLLLHFGAVDWETTVYVNGKQVGTHRGGYDPFSFDVTDALKADGPQELTVAVWDPSDDGTQPRGKQVKKPGGIFYTPVTGIWQTVWLEAVPKTHVRSLKIVPTLTDVEVSVDVANLPAGDAANQIRITVLAGQEVLKSATGATAKIQIPNPKLWTPESPHLYDLRVQVGDDTVTGYFGLRTVEVKKDDKGVNRTYLNGQPIFMAGPLDQGYWPDGLYTAPTDDALKYDIEITKQLGFNTTRKHVKVEPARWYYHCDKLGLIVWQDMPSGDKSVAPNQGEVTRTAEAKQNHEAEYKAMIDALRNHPSIVMWVVFNEGWGQYDTVRITNWTKQYDPTRLANPASGWNDFPAGDVIDMHKYPAPGAPPLQPNRAAVLGEYGGLGLAVPGHMWQKEHWGYKGVRNGEVLTRQYVRMMMDAYKLRDTDGLNAAIYTQITDVETEANGLLTYDRAVIKVDTAQIVLANQGKAIVPPEAPRHWLLATSEKDAQTWRYTTDKPADGWQKPDFDASAWKQAPGGFGTEGTPGSQVRTKWDGRDIWIRRDFDLAAAPGNPLLIMHHDEDAEVYINGVLAAKATNFVGSYEEFDLTPEGKAALKPGKNTIAVHCKQTTGGQYIDVGLVDQK
jgi:hypothetical protein